MSRIYWIALFALGLALVWSNNARGQENQSTSATDDAEVGEEQPATDNVPTSAPPVEAAPVYIYNAPNSPPDTSNQDRYAEADLRAQRDMSRWTLIAAFAAVSGALISVVAVVLVYKTLNEARTTTRAATLSTRLTKRVLDHERENSRRELRAYVLTKRVGMKIEGPEYEGAPVLVLLGGEFKNTGNTPAFNVRATWNGSICDDDFCPVPPQFEDKPRHAGVLPPSGENTIAVEIKLDNIDKFAEVVAFGKQFSIYGRIEYTDAFGERFRHDFKYDTLDITAPYALNEGEHMGMAPDGRICNLISLGPEKANDRE